MPITPSPDSGTINLATPPNPIPLPTVPGPVLALPFINGVSPNTGPTAGGTALAAIGGNFEPGATVRVGNATASVVGLSPSRIDVITPPGPAGITGVQVTNPSGLSAGANGVFTYDAKVFTPVDLPPLPPPGAPSPDPATGGTLILRPDASVVPIAAREMRRVRIQLLRTRVTEEVSLTVSGGSPFRLGESTATIEPTRTLGNFADLLITGPESAPVDTRFTVNATVGNRRDVSITPATVTAQARSEGRLSFRDASARLVPGQVGTYEFFIRATGFPELTLSVSGAFTNVRLSRATLTGFAPSASITVTAGAEMSPGTYVLTVRAEGGGQSYVGQLPITVPPVVGLGQSFLRVDDIALEVAEGQSRSTTVRLMGMDVFGDVFAETTAPLRVSFTGGTLTLNRPITMTVTGGKPGAIRVTIRHFLGDARVLPTDVTVLVVPRSPESGFPEVPDDPEE